MPDVLLAEDAAQVDNFLLRGLRGRWIALGPSAMARLGQLGIDHRIPEEFYAAEELEARCLETHRAILRLCDRLDERAHETAPDLRQMAIRPFLSHIVPLTVLIDGAQSRILKLQAIANAHPGDALVIHRSPPLPWTPLLLFPHGDTLWGHLAAMPGWNTEIRCVERSAAGMAPPLRGGRWLAQGSVAAGRRWVGEHPTLASSLRATVQLRSLSGLVGALTPGGHGRLLIMSSPEWRTALAPLRRRGWRFLFAGDADVRRVAESGAGGSVTTGATAAGPPVLEDEDRDLFAVGGVRFYGLLESRLCWIRDEVPPRARRVYGWVRRLRDDYGVKALLRSSTVSGMGHVVSQAAQSLGIPVVAWQHGLVGFHETTTEMAEFTDLMSADVTLCYGAGAERGYGRAACRFPAVLVPTGSARLHEIRRGAERRALRAPARTSGAPRRILYLAGNCYHNAWYFGFPPPFSDCRFFRDQRTLALALSRLAADGGHHVTIQPRVPQAGLEPAWLREVGGSSRVVVARDGVPREYLLARADAVVADLPWTVVLDAIASHLPLYVLMRHWRYDPESRRLLDLRAVTAEDPVALVRDLQAFLAGGEYPRLLRDDRFLEFHGFPPLSDPPVQLAAACLDDVLTRGWSGGSLSMPPAVTGGGRSEASGVVHGSPGPCTAAPVERPGGPAG